MRGAAAAADLARPLEAGVAAGAACAVHTCVPLLPKALCKDTDTLRFVVSCFVISTFIMTLVAGMFLKQRKLAWHTDVPVESERQRLL